MWTLSGFADEISPDLEEQCATLSAESMRFLEFRGVWNKNVLDLTDEELSRVAAALKNHGIGVSSIGSPIGKISITDDFEPHRERFARALDIAKRFDARYVRIFSFFMPKGADPGRYRDEVISRLRELVDMADQAGVTLLHENERDIYGDIPKRCLDLLTSLESPCFRAVWDAANYVQCGVRPFPDGYRALRPYVEYVHIKDAIASTGRVVPAGEGDGAIRETIAALRNDGFDGFFSMEPHLAAAGTFAGFSGPGLFRKATQSFKKLLDEQGISWS